MSSGSVALSRADAAWYRMGTPDNQMVVTALLEFDDRIDVERLRALMQERVAGPLPRFHQRVHRGLLGPRWEDDPEFRIAEHVTRETLLAGEGTLADLVGRSMGEELPGDRPLWQLRVVDRPDGGSSVLARIHHSIADGIALVAVLLSLTDLDAAGTVRTPVPSPPVAGLRRVTVASRVRGIAHAIVDLAGQTRSLLHVALLRRDDAAPFHGELSGEKRAAWSDAIDLDALKAFKPLGYSVNDVAVAAAAGALRRWMIEHGHSPDVTMRATVPMNLRPLERSLELGNEFGLLFLDLPLHLEEPLERLAASRRGMEELKRSSEAGAALNSLRLLGSMPKAGQRLVSDFFATKASAVMSNVPGPPVQLHLAGKAMRDVMFWVPQSGPVGVGISLLTYDGRVRMGLASDSAFIDSPAEVTRLFADELKALSRAALGPPELHLG